MPEKLRSIRVDDQTWERVQAAAERAGCTVNAYVNRLLRWAMGFPHPEILGDGPNSLAAAAGSVPSGPGPVVRPPADRIILYPEGRPGEILPTRRR